MSSRSRSLAALSLAAACVTALGACGKDDSDEGSAAKPAHLALSAREYALDSGGVRSVRAGLVTVSLRNAGRQDHGLQIYRLKDGVSFARFRSTLAKGGDEALGPVVSSVHGGTQNVPPGKRWQMTITLKPGTYVLEDFGEGPDGKHNARDRGMVTSLRVTSPQRAAAEPPARAVSVSLEQRGCRVPPVLPRRGTLAISTKGSGFFEFVMGRVEPSAAARELRKANDGDDETFPETKEPVDLLSSIGGGQTAYVATDLRPGTYIVLCFSGRPGGGSPAIHGDTAVVR